MNYDHFKAVLGILCHVMIELEESVTFVDGQESPVLNVFVAVRFEILTVVIIQVTVFRDVMQFGSAD